MVLERLTLMGAARRTSVVELYPGSVQFQILQQMVSNLRSQYGRMNKHRLHFDLDMETASGVDTNDNCNSLRHKHCVGFLASDVGEVGRVVRI